MTYLVTGANGFLGRGVVKQLLETGAHVIATDFSCEDVDGRATSVEADLFHVADPFQYFGCPNIVVHLASRNGFVHNADTHLADLPMHYKFLKKMIDAGVQRVCVMGSMHEIGFFEGSINEHTPCNPMSMYGIAKNALRQSIQTYVTGNKVDFIWLRGYYIVANDTVGSSIFSKITKATQEGKTEFPFTMGQNQYDYLDYDEFCNQVVAAVTQNKVTGIINICSGHPEKLCDRVERFIRENSYKIKLVYGAFPDRPYDSKAVWGNSDKIARILRTKC